jgi:hypothetical protein
VFLIQKYFCRGVPPIGLLLSVLGPMHQSPVSTWHHAPHHSLPGRASAATHPRHKGVDRSCPGRQRRSEAVATLPAPDRPCPKPVAARPRSAPPPGKRASRAPDQEPTSVVGRCSLGVRLALCKLAVPA